MKIAGASLNQTPIDWENNEQNISDSITEAKSKSIELLCLPELCIPSYGCQDLFLAPWVQAKSLELLLKITQSTSNIAVCLGLPLLVKGKLYNCCAFIVDTKIKGF